MDYVLTDIHFHTNSSYDAYENANKGVFDIDLFINNEKSSQHKVGLLVKTDHNILDYNYFISLREKIRKSGLELVIIPGIELNSTDSVHWIFVFDDLRMDEQINGVKVGHLLDLKIKELFNYSSIVPSNKELEEAQIKKLNIGKFVSILNDLEISFLAIPHLNKTNGFYNKLKKNKALLRDIQNYLNDNIISGFESKNHNEFLVNGILQTEQKIASLKENLDDINGDEIERREIHLELLKKLKLSIDRNYVSSIYGSDFHGDKQLGMGKYELTKDLLFYMKSLPSFEGLRFALLDYESRIFSIDRREKYRKKGNTYIRKIILEENGEKKELRLGDGLNTIIGSRGSGKSYLIKSIIGNNEDYAESDIKSQIQINEIEFGDGSTSRILDKTLFDILNQKGKSSTNKFNIYEILAEAPYNTEKFVKSIKKYFHTSPIKQEQIKEFVELFNRYLDCLKNEEKLQIKKANLEFLKEYNEYIKNQSEILLIKDKFDGLHTLIKRNVDLKKQCIISLDRDKNYAERLSEDLKKLKNTNEYLLLEKTGDIRSFETLITELDYFSNNAYFKLKENYEKNKDNLSNLTTRLSKITSSISQDLTNEEKGYNEKFSLLENYIHDAVVHLRERKVVQERLIKQYEKDIYDEDIIEFSINDVIYSICSRYKFNILNLTDEQKESFFENYKWTPTSTKLKNLITNGTNDQISKYFESVDARRKDYHIKMPVTSPEVLIKNVTDQTDYENIIKMSPGQRSNLLLDMILQSTTDKILILDQPEDDLDNETIYKSIVQKLRNLKLRRQLIVITHNANIAINGDSDYLVVCQNKDNTFSYWSDKMESLIQHEFHSINSSLNDVRQLEIAATILDGGKEALRKRVKTIGYKDLFLKGELKDED